jgi:hypothetical protein
MACKTQISPTKTGSLFWRIDQDTLNIDIVDFFHASGVGISVGMVPVDFLLEQLKFWDFGGIFGRANHATFEDTSIPAADIYHLKNLYLAGLRGEQFHTPVALYSNHMITKGSKKIVAAKMMGMQHLPAVMTHEHGVDSLPGMHKIATDADLLQFIQQTATGISLDQPAIGLKWFQKPSDSRYIPTIHFIDLNHDIAWRPTWEDFLKQDANVWHGRRTIWVNHMPTKAHKYLQFRLKPHAYDIPKDQWPDDVYASVTATSPEEAWRLAHMAVWFSSDDQGQPMGCAYTVDQTRTIVYNNSSNLRIQILENLLDFKI